MKSPKTPVSLIKEFIELPTVALAGVSTDPKKFGFTAYRDLKERGWKIIPVNPKYESISGEPCYPSLSSIPFPVDGIISMVTKANTIGILREAHALGVSYAWIQQKSETPEAVEFCREKEMKAIFGKCILMYYPPVKSIHGFHRWLMKIFSGNKMP